MASANVKLSVGTVVSVAAAVPATYDATGFAALTFTAIGEVTNLGEFGGSAQITQHIPLATGIVAKRKGSIDYGTMAMQIGKDIVDAGQVLLKAGFDGAAAYDVHSFKITDVDGNIAYFTGLVGSFTKVFNDANTVAGVNCNVELDNKVIDA